MKRHTPFIVILLLMAFSSIGWGLNLYKLSQADFVAPYKNEVIRVIGIIPLVGAFIGWIDIEDTPL